MLLSELKKGQIAIIESINDEELAVKLMEMGCLPGETVELLHKAPFGDPLAIRVAGYKLSLRVSEAASVIVNN